MPNFFQKRNRYGLCLSPVDQTPESSAVPTAVTHFLHRNLYCSKPPSAGYMRTETRSAHSHLKDVSFLIWGGRWFHSGMVLGRNDDHRFSHIFPPCKVSCLYAALIIIAKWLCRPESFWVPSRNCTLFTVAVDRGLTREICEKQGNTRLSSLLFNDWYFTSILLIY